MALSHIVNKLWPSRIRSQLILGIALATVLLMLLFVFELYNRQRDFFLKLNRERATAISANLANSATPYVISYELTGLQSLVNGFKANPGLEYAIILTHDGTVLAHTDPRYLGLKAVDSISTKLEQASMPLVLVENNSILDIATPIINNKEIVGWARIGLSQEFVEHGLRDIRNRGLLYILLSLIIGSLFALYVARRLSKGLRKLVTTAEKIKAGDREVRVGEFRSFEIAHLGNAMNQMLDEISSNEKLLSNVLESMPVGVWILDKDGNIVSGNPAGVKLLKCIAPGGMEDYKNFKIWFTATGEEVKREEWSGAVAVSGGKPLINREIEVECFDKSHMIVLNSAIPLRDKNEVIIGAINIKVDITDQKKAEHTLRELNYANVERVKELNCLYRMSEISNDPDKSMEDILQNCADIVPASYQYPEITCTRIIFNGQYFSSEGFAESFWKQEAIISSKDNWLGKIQVFYKKEMPPEAEGPFLREERLLINSLADILGSAAEKRKAESELRESEEMFRSLVEETPVGVFIVQDDFFVYANPGFEKITGYSNAELFGWIRFQQLIHKEDRELAEKNYRLRIRGERPPEQYELRAVKKEGDIIYVDLIMSAIIYNQKPAVIGSVIDKTHRVEEEKRIGKAVTDAQEKERTEIGMELHDNVKQIMAASLMSLDFVKKNYDRKEESIGIINNVRGYILDAINELRRLSHQLAPSVNEDTNTLTEKIAKLMYDTKITDKMEVFLDIDEFTETISADIQLAFYRILQEQFTNILKYSKATVLLIMIKKKEKEIYLTIKDDGVGFDNNQKKTGIGLENIRRRVSVLNGEVKIISAPGEGCAVNVSVPFG